MTSTGHNKLPIWKIAGAIIGLSFAALTMSSPAQADSHARRYGRLHHTGTLHARTDVRDSYARVYSPAVPAPVVYPPVAGPYDDLGYEGTGFYPYPVYYGPYHCGIGVGNSPLACEPGD